ncbi:mitochondrial intermembrane space import and assembly protein 40 [Lepidopterella palustris CBS 459.81]|uniref:Mitochondrial intermembrane space import and assembly protein 40 n=1 Tax=Lepidopterella palustris CBS 459.81 TaxID=1314670 RepID=A0A8E2EHZ7_9PEZI|nr:mitochondrial intermembrane space import and assembly protein 40 [Lepidopterella palustris CBS 459.81]
MFRPASRLIARSPIPRPFVRSATARRFLSNASPTQKSRSWKSSAVRWGLAAGAVYYYNTSSVFAEEPAYSLDAAPHIPETEQESETLPTIETLAAQRQERKAAASSPPISEQTAIGHVGEAIAAPGSVEELEEEADQQGAFNPETGEINWDCPCLGGMAHGPCGEEFKAAFSCFVYSTEEPKGMDCIDKFKGMQDCFRLHPDIYGGELEDEDDITAEEGDSTAATASIQDSTDPEDSPSQFRAEKVADHKPHLEPGPEHEIKAKQERAQTATEQVKREHEPHSESEEVVPKAWHDRSSSEENS